MAKAIGTRPIGTRPSRRPMAKAHRDRSHGDPSIAKAHREGPWRRPRAEREQTLRAHLLGLTPAQPRQTQWPLDAIQNGVLEPGAAAQEHIARPSAALRGSRVL